jgi:hypothetical protein
MAVTWKIYADAGLTTELTTLSLQNTTLGGSYADAVVYFGSVASGKTLQASSAPGTDPVQITVVDSTGGSGLAASAVKLALSAGGLAGATGGAALTVGTTLSSGVANAIPVYVRVASGIATPGTYTDVSLRSTLVIEA